MSNVSDERRRNMAAVKGKDTVPELIVRRALHHDGFRYRLHSGALPGKPDLVLAKYAAVIFVNGCFWHGHECRIFRWPRTRQEFWREKILRNRDRDQRDKDKLRDSGWRIATVWECSLKLDAEAAIKCLEEWVLGVDVELDLNLSALVDL